MKKKLTQTELKRQLHYDPETGVFTWKVDSGRGGRFKAGSQAGGLKKNKGYVEIRINGILYRAHRLAWLDKEGYFPEHGIDHRNGIGSNNRWNNLRHATQTCNMQNQKIQTNNICGFHGVYWNKRDNKWCAQIMISGKQTYLGIYTDPLEAALARYTAEVNCASWNCNHRSELAKAIKTAWPEFKFGE